MISEEYEYYRREMVKRNNQGNFWSMSNEVLAKDYYEEAIKEFPNLKMCQVRSCQYFWMNNKAEEKLKTIIQNCISKMETDTAVLYSALKIIEDGLEDKEPQKGRQKIEVYYKKELIAEFANKEDAQHFISWKKENILRDMNGEILDKIAEEHHLDRRYPGLFPSNICEEYYKNAMKKIADDLIIKELTISKDKTTSDDHIVRNQHTCVQRKKVR